MIGRCHRKHDDSYSNYGARGIAVCEKWRNDYLAFKAWAINTGYNDSLTIERQDNNGNYDPSNCKWIPKHQQSSNTRRNIKITAFGETKLAKEWSRDPRCLVSDPSLRDRIRRGWDSERAITEPFNLISNARRGGLAIMQKRGSVGRTIVAQKAARKRWTIFAFGEGKLPKEWERDSRCTVTVQIINQRLKKGWSPESAISEPETKIPD